MMNDPITKVMQDASEIVRYDQVGIPLYIREGLLSSYPDHRRSATGMRISNGYRSAPVR